MKIFFFYFVGLNGVTRAPSKQNSDERTNVAGQNEPLRGNKGKITTKDLSLQPANYHEFWT